MDPVQMSERFMRQIEIADPAKFKYPVTLLGVGAIGSAAAIAIGKMGCPKGMILIDFDWFEEHNVANQLCQETVDIGVPKVAAVAELCKKMGHIGPCAEHHRKLVGENLVVRFGPHKGHVESARPYIEGIVLSTPDSMKARKDLWALCKYNVAVPTVIDVRVAGMGQNVVIHTTGTMLPDDIKRYEATLYDDSEASIDPCGARGVIFTTLIAGGIVASLVRKIQLEEPIPRTIELDVSTLQLTQVLHNGERVTNQEALALASVK